MIKYHKLENLSDSDSDTDNTAGILPPSDQKLYRNLREFGNELRLNSHENNVAEISYKLNTPTLITLLDCEWMKFRVRYQSPFDI